ncbi:MAG: hypothetical protein HY904_03240 [Deltaproteobacteria bacterium]|nr:hypothetical protein [Deltaproteobacteria bacterium]
MGAASTGASSGAVSTLPDAGSADAGDAGADAGPPPPFIRDDANAVAYWMGPEGGNTTVPTPSGDIIVEIPAGALDAFVEIHATPLTSFPLHGFTRGLHLEPEGLNFIVPVTLRFVGAAAADAWEFRYTATAEDVHLVRPVVDGADLLLPFIHFSGGGVGRGGLPSTSPTSPLGQAASELAAEQDATVALAIVTGAFAHVLPLLQAAGGPAADVSARDALFRAGYNAYVLWERLATGWGTAVTTGSETQRLQAHALLANALVQYARDVNLEAVRTGTTGPLVHLGRRVAVWAQLLGVDTLRTELSLGGLARSSVLKPVIEDLNVIPAETAGHVVVRGVAGMRVAGADAQTGTVLLQLENAVGASNGSPVLAPLFTRDGAFTAEVVPSTGPFALVVSVAHADLPPLEFSMTRTMVVDGLDFTTLELAARPATTGTARRVLTVPAGGQAELEARVQRSGVDTAGVSIRFFLDGPGTLSADVTAAGADGIARTTFTAGTSREATRIRAVATTSTWDVEDTVVVMVSPVSVAVVPTSATVNVPNTFPFTATSTGSIPGVRWETSGGGTLDGTGLFTPRGIPGHHWVQATSFDDPNAVDQVPLDVRGSLYEGSIRVLLTAYNPPTEQYLTLPAPFDLRQWQYQAITTARCVLPAGTCTLGPVNVSVTATLSTYNSASSIPLTWMCSSQVTSTAEALAWTVSITSNTLLSSLSPLPVDATACTDRVGAPLDHPPETVTPPWATFAYTEQAALNQGGWAFRSTDTQAGARKGESNWALWLPQ